VTIVIGLVSTLEKGRRWPYLAIYLRTMQAWVCFDRLIIVSLT